ncbi:MAG TPA: peptidyl-prolyl cis-trans isomerase [Polyangiaceae bacterium]|nr:peptidyl-prolyl cis-trans isomerase [Polyangiaceae bacterium]
MPRADRALEWLSRLLCGLSVACSPAARNDAAASGSGPASVHVDRRIAAQLEQGLGVAPERALELATEDALLATELERTAPQRAHALERLALARALERSLSAHAVERGPATDAEVAELTAERWWALDRPRLVQVQHAVVLTERSDAEARALCERIRDAVRDVHGEAAFAAAVKRVSSGKFKVKVEKLDPVALDGRVVDPDRPPPSNAPPQAYALEVARAAQQLQQPGEVSPVVQSPFGYHVLRLLRVIEPHQPSLEERRRLLTPEIDQRRALTEQNELLARVRREAAPDQARAALTLMGRLSVAP